jgi:hypothetical protein
MSRDVHIGSAALTCSSQMGLRQQCYVAAQNGWVGSNAFGFEEPDGQRKHAVAHYLHLVTAGPLNLRPMLAHTFRVAQWRHALLAIANQGDAGPAKVAIDQP